MVNLGNDATISTTPLLKIFISGESLPVAVLELVDYQDHLASCTVDEIGRASTVHD